MAASARVVLPDGAWPPSPSDNRRTLDEDTEAKLAPLNHDVLPLQRAVPDGQGSHRASEVRQLVALDDARPASEHDPPGAGSAYEERATLALTDDNSIHVAENLCRRITAEPLTRWGTTA